jgi:hypothetical protein
LICILASHYQDISSSMFFILTSDENHNFQQHDICQYSFIQIIMALNFFAEAKKCGFYTDLG